MWTIWVHYKASHKGSYFFPCSLEWFYSLFWNEEFSLNKKKSIFPKICWCCYCQFDNCDIRTFHRKSGGFLGLYFFSPRQLRVLKELLMKYWTSVVNIYLQQYNSSAISFSQNKILIWNSFPLEKIPMNLFETVLRIPKFVKVFHLNVSGWSI